MWWENVDKKSQSQRLANLRKPFRVEIFVLAIKYRQESQPKILSRLQEIEIDDEDDDTDVDELEDCELLEHSHGFIITSVVSFDNHHFIDDQTCDYINNNDNQRSDDNHRILKCKIAKPIVAVFG